MISRARASVAGVNLAPSEPTMPRTIRLPTAGAVAPRESPRRCTQASARSGSPEPFRCHSTADRSPRRRRSTSGISAGGASASAPLVPPLPRPPWIPVRADPLAAGARFDIPDRPPLPLGRMPRPLHGLVDAVECLGRPVVRTVGLQLLDLVEQAACEAGQLPRA